MLDPTLLGVCGACASGAGKAAGPFLDWLTKRGERYERQQTTLVAALQAELASLRQVEIDLRRDNRGLAERQEQLEDELASGRRERDGMLTAIRDATRDREALRTAWERQSQELLFQIQGLQDRLSLHEATCPGKTDSSPSPS